MNNKKLDDLEIEIEKQQRNVSFDTKEYTIEIIVKKYLEEINKDRNEFFVPDYQRDFVWDRLRQSRFIESLMIGLPIPYIFLAETESGRYEIVDGSQRIRTLAAYINNELTIKGVEKVSELNNLKFRDLADSRQRKFKNISMKMIVLSEHTSDETKNDIFERINRGSDLLKDMEYRKGIYTGLFNDFISLLAKDKIFIQLTPIAKWLVKRQEREELVLRFLAFSEWYPHFNNKSGIARQLDEYMKKKNMVFASSEGTVEKAKLLAQFKDTMSFIYEYFPYGFAKNQNASQVARPYFEALSVGTNLALLDNKELNKDKDHIIKLVTNRQFINSVSGRYQTHRASTIRKRIDYIKVGLSNE